MILEIQAQTSSSDDALGRTWNNVDASASAANSPYTLNDIANASTGWSLAIGNPTGNDSTPSQIGFNNPNSDGTTSPTGDAASRYYPASATRDSGYGNTATFDRGTVPAVLLTLSNLSPAETYDFYFFASRMNVSDNRETAYQVTGGTTSTTYLNAANNTGNIVAVSGMTPDANNQISITVSPGSNNNNGSKFYYLGVLEIASVPEPTSMGVLGLGAMALLRRHRKA